jgi:hypothetical protein
LEFKIDEVRFDEVEGAFEIERQSVVDLHDKRDFQIATHQFFKDNEYIGYLPLPSIDPFDLFNLSTHGPGLTPMLFCNIFDLISLLISSN